MVTRVTSRCAGNLFLTIQVFHELCNSMRICGLRVKVVRARARAPDRSVTVRFFGRLEYLPSADRFRIVNHRADISHQ